MNTEATTTGIVVKFSVYDIPFGVFRSTHETREEAEAAAARALNPCKIVEVETLPTHAQQGAPGAQLVETMEGDLVPIESATLCEYFEEYTTEETFEVINRNGDSVQYSARAIESEAHRLVYYEDEDKYYYVSNLWAHELCITADTETVARMEDCYYSERTGEYYEHEPEDDEDEERYRREYHSDGNTYFHRFTSNPPRFFIGYEIEKEDRGALTSIHIEDFEHELPKWRKESDGSLCSESGYELVSPCFELSPDDIHDYIKRNDILKRHINASKSERCGGHINLSEDGKTGQELFESVQGYTPLLHALYYKRINRTYSTAKSNCIMKASRGDKYQSVRIHNNRIELRIISAVPNINTLHWRTRLCEYILKNQTSDPREAFINFHDTELKALIAEVYNTPEKLNRLNKRLIDYTRNFEQIDLTDAETREKYEAKLQKPMSAEITEAASQTEDTDAPDVEN